MFHLGRHFCVSAVMPGTNGRPKRKSLFINSSPILETRSSNEPPCNGDTFSLFRFCNRPFNHENMFHLGRHFCVSAVMPGIDGRPKGNPPFINSSPILEPRSSNEPPWKVKSFKIFRLGIRSVIDEMRIHFGSHFVSRLLWPTTLNRH